MKARNRRLIFWGVLLAVLMLGLLLVFRPQPIAVDLVEITRENLVVTLNDEGEARVHDVYVLSAPVTGHMRRIVLHAGDPVIALETIVAEIEPIDASLLDPRSEAQAQADVRAAESAEALARANVEQAKAELDFARREHERAMELIVDGTISQRDLDSAERALRTRRAALATAQAALDVQAYALERALAALVSPANTQLRGTDCACIDIKAPVAGRILRVLQQSEGVVTAGTPLVEIGDPLDLEIVVDLLSTDAVKVAHGQRVIIDNWGGDSPLYGRVRLVEPFAFTKISALGIEEQRVNVVIDLTSPPESRAKLAHGYQVDARIVLWEGSDILTVPSLALFRDGVQWAVFVETDGTAELRHLDIGRRGDYQVEIVNGLSEGERVVLHPSDRILPGVRISERL